MKEKLEIIKNDLIERKEQLFAWDILEKITRNVKEEVVVNNYNLTTYFRFKNAIKIIEELEKIENLDSQKEYLNSVLKKALIDEKSWLSICEDNLFSIKKQNVAYINVRNIIRNLQELLKLYDKKAIIICEKEFIF